MTAGEAAPFSLGGQGGSGTASPGPSASLPPLLLLWHLSWLPAAAIASVVMVYLTRQWRRCRLFLRRGHWDNLDRKSLHKRDGLSSPPPPPSSALFTFFAAIAYFAAAAFLIVILLAAMCPLRQLASYVAVASSMAAGALADPSAASSACNVTSAWPGWPGIRYAFIFGDSYTTTGFNYSITPAPSPDDPMGNPPYPGWTASNGPNWVGYLTTKYNASRLQTYNLAYGGATVDSDLVAPYEPTVLSMKDQVHSEFMPGYTSRGNSDLALNAVHPSAPDAPAWHGNDTVFALWIGINDVGNSYSKGVDGTDGTKALNAKIFEVYGDLVGILYNAGARNFVFLTVPPVNRSPLTKASGAAAQALEKADITAFNDLVRTRVAGDLQAAHTDDVNVWVVDTQVPFNAVLDNPAAYPQTAGLRNTTMFCAAYQNGTPKPDTLVPACGIPVNQYFWLNSLHPTYPIHDVVAQQVAKALSDGPNVCSSTNHTSSSAMRHGMGGGM